MKSLAFFFILSVHFCFTQNNFTGRLLDANSKQPIPFGHFSIEKNQGFISDERGFFSLNYSAKEIEVKVSALGYQNKTTRLTSNQDNLIYLTPKTEALDEVILDYEDPAKALIRKVVENIPANYPIQQEQVYGRYRENAYYDSLKTKPIYKVEAHFKADKFSYAKKSTSGNVQLLENSIDVINMDSLKVKFYGGIHGIHYEDYVLKRGGPLTLSRLDKYRLKIKDTLSFDNRTVIQLDYQRKKNRGSFYIDLDSYALIRVERSLDPKEINEDEFNFLKIYKHIYFREIISYEKDSDHRWRFKFSHGKAGFISLKRKEELHLEGTFIITQHLPKAELIPQADRFPFRGILSDELIYQNKEEQNELNTKQKIFSLLLKFRSIYGMAINQFKLQSHQAIFSPLSKTYRTIATTETIWTTSIRTEYIINNKWGIGYNTVESLKNRNYAFNALNLNFHHDLSRRNRTHLTLALDFGIQKLRKYHETESFENSFQFGGKTFDSGRVSLYSETRAWTLNPSAGISFRLNPLFHMGVNASYFLPLKSSNGIYAREENEFWFWNRAKAFEKDTSQPKSFITNQYSTGVYLIFNF